MEDEIRPLPTGWVRQFDPTENHQFFVDTTSDPPRSTWTHPYDDDVYLNSLSAEERKKLERVRRTMTLDDVAAESSDDEDGGHHSSSTKKTAALPPREGASSSSSSGPTGIHKFTRKMKDKITSSTHEEREAQRKHRAEQEQKAYHAHLRARQAMIRALETGEPQLLGKDSRGRDVYIEPPQQRSGGMMGPSRYGNNAYMYNPYMQGPFGGGGGVRYARPQGLYGRPYGYGYGGGMGLGAPLAAGLLGGTLLGGALLF